MLRPTEEILLQLPSGKGHVNDGELCKGEGNNPTHQRQ